MYTWHHIATVTLLLWGKSRKRKVMPHHLSHRKTLPHAEFQIVVSGISEASKCFPTIELLDEICQICLMYFTSSSRATSKMPLDLVEEETLYGSTTDICHGLGEMSGSWYWYSRSPRDGLWTFSLFCYFFFSELVFSFFLPFVLLLLLFLPLPLCSSGLGRP